jgi:hypothetical protein
MSTTPARVAISAIILCMVASPLSAQSSIPVDGRLLRAGTDTFVVSYGGNIIGRGVMQTQRISDGGIAAWRQVYVFHGTGGDVSSDTLIMNAITLEPIREARASSAGHFVMRFSKAEVVTTKLSEGHPPVESRLVLATPKFSSAALDAIVQTLPLSSGMHADIGLFYPAPSPRGAVRTTVRVVGTEDVANPGAKPRVAWVVVTGGPEDETKYWIDKETRAVLKYDTHEGTALIEFRR